MAQIFQINDISLTYIMRGNWLDIQLAGVLDGQTVHNRFRPHIWQSNAQAVTEFDTLFALEGQQVKITTTNHADRNADFVTYYAVTFRQITARQASINMETLRCEFLVRF